MFFSRDGLARVFLISTLVGLTGCLFQGTSIVSSGPSNQPLAKTLVVDPTSDFQARCAAAGVLVCEGFDDPTEFTPAVWPNTGVYPPDDGGPLEVFYDSTVKSSGNGSARFFIPANYTDDASGTWMQNFGVGFGAHSTFYVQYRFRMDTAMQSTNWEDVANGGSSPKISIFHHQGVTCGDMEITTNNREASSMSMMYTQCGDRIFGVEPGTTLWSDSVPPYQFQNGYYNCAYPSTPSGPGGCFTMPANTWMTFYFQVSLGDWSQPNSHVEAWIGIDGQPLQPFVNVTNMIMPQSGDSLYDTVSLMNYMTAFGQSGPSKNPAANSWYDELIVSSQPIAAPAVNSGAPLPTPAPAPNPPTGLKIVSVQ